MSPFTTKTIKLCTLASQIVEYHNVSQTYIESRFTCLLNDLVQTGELKWFYIFWPDDIECCISFEASDMTGPYTYQYTQVFDHLGYGIISVNTPNDAYNRAMKGI